MPKEVTPQQQALIAQILRDVEFLKELGEYEFVEELTAKARALLNELQRRRRTH